MIEIKQIYNIEHIYDLVNFEYNTHYTYIQDQRFKKISGRGGWLNLQAFILLNLKLLKVKF